MEEQVKYAVNATRTWAPKRPRCSGKGERTIHSYGSHVVFPGKSSRPRVRRPRHGFSLLAKPRTGHAGQKGGLTFQAGESHSLQNQNEAEAWRNGPSACDTGGGREKGPESRGLLPEVWFQDKSICWWMETHRGHGVTSRGRCEIKLYCAFGSSRGLRNDEPHGQ